jgi:hypothetical protein
MKGRKKVYLYVHILKSCTCPKHDNVKVNSHNVLSLLRNVEVKKKDFFSATPGARIRKGVAHCWWVR